MTEKEQVDQTLQLAYLTFFQGVLVFLQAFQRGEKEQKAEFDKLKKLATEFKGYLPEPHRRGEVDIDADIDSIVSYAGDYYPDLETSDELRGAVEKLGTNLASTFGVTA